jgi:hypothetical protein
MNEALHGDVPWLAQDSALRHPGVSVLLWAVPAVPTILVGLLHGTFFIDDAYITFRYAENLAAGHGLVFNPGEPVLGTTTPLCATVLAGLKRLGLAVPTSALWLGLLSMAGVVLLLQTLARSSVSLSIAATGLANVNWRSFRTGLENREAAYFEIGEWLAERTEIGDVIFVGEVGVLGYLLLDQVLVDSSGINSPEVFALRRDDLTTLRENTPQGSVCSEGTWRWAMQVIDQLEPKYVVTKYPWLHIGKIEDGASFQARYTRVGPDNVMLLDYRVYGRH